MAEINVAQLTDSQLRKKLISFGQSVGPVTKSTRNIWEKKLLKILSDENSLKSSNSAEDADEKKTSTRRRSSSRRRSAVVTSAVSNTVATQRTITSSTRRVPTVSQGKKFAPFSSDEEEDNIPEVTVISANTSPIGFSTPDNQSVRKRKSLTGNANSNISKSTSIPSRNTRNSKLAPEINKEFSDDDFSSSYSISGRNSKVPLHLNGQTKDAKTPDRLHSYSYTQRSYVTPKSQNVNDSNNIRDEIDASLIQIRNKFSSKKPSPPASRISYTSNINKKNNNDQYEGESDEDEEELDAEFVSYHTTFYEGIKWFGLVALSLIFVASAVGMFYIYSEDNGMLAIASSDSLNRDKTKFHVEINKLLSSWHLYLSERSGLYECGYFETKWSRKDELVNNAKQNDQTDQGIIAEALKKVEEDFQKYFQIQKTDDVTLYTSTSSHKPLTCRIKQAVSVILFRLFIVISILVIGIAIYYFMKKRWTTDDEETRQMLYFVDKIIDTLRRHHDVCMTNKDIPPYLPIPHVRDMLIPLAKRKKMAKIWQKAVHFLNSSDSRVRVETQEIAGEDFEVWRWIGICTPKMKKGKMETKDLYLSDNHTKCWQGPAFDEIDKVVRMPIVTPTPCLKIRYMHEGPGEKGEDWAIRVMDAVLEKTIKDGAKILHLYVDEVSKEGCVYVKCDSLDSAGKAFRSMYGNWFDGRLVIVKFVTLARYHQRFPNALNCATPIKPSGTSESSLSWIDENK